MCVCLTHIIIRVPFCASYKNECCMTTSRRPTQNINNKPLCNVPVADQWCFNPCVNSAGEIHLAASQVKRILIPKSPGGVGWLEPPPTRNDDLSRPFTSLLFPNWFSHHPKRAWFPTAGEADGNCCSDVDKHCELSFKRQTCLCGVGEGKKKSIQSLFRGFASVAE